MKKNPIISAILASHLAIACLTVAPSAQARGDHKQASEQSVEAEKGPNNGRMLRDGDLAIELAIFETGVPPEFRIYASNQGNELSPQDIDVNVTLTRLGNVTDDISFYQENNYLRGVWKFMNHTRLWSLSLPIIRVKIINGSMIILKAASPLVMILR